MLGSTLTSESEKSMAVRVVLVDDHEIMREGLCILLGKYEDIEVVGQAGEGRAAVDLVDKLRPDVVIMDVAMPNLNGIEATRQMIQRNPSLKVLGLSTYSGDDIIANMFKAGACGYMLKESAFSELKAAILTILEGRIFLCSHTLKTVCSDYVNLLTNPSKANGEVLSGREREILQLVAEGYSSKEIAQVLKLRTKTVDSHREHIMKKLDIRTIPGLTKYAIRNGMTKP